MVFAVFRGVFLWIFPIFQIFTVLMKKNLDFKES